MSVWLAVDEDGGESISDELPIRTKDNIFGGYWVMEDGFASYGVRVNVPKGTIKKLIGCELTWEDEPVEWNGE